MDAHLRKSRFLCGLSLSVCFTRNTLDLRSVHVRPIFARLINNRPRECIQWKKYWRHL